MTEPFDAAEQAAFTAYGALRHPGEMDRLRDALTAYRGVLTAAGALRDDTVLTAHGRELAAQFLAKEAGFYTGDQWRLLLRSREEVEFAHRKALEQAPVADDEHRRDLAHARRVLLTTTSQDDLPAASLPTVPNPQEGGDQR